MESRLREQGLRRTPHFRTAWNSDGQVGAVLRTAPPTACKNEAGTIPCFRDQAKNSVSQVYDAVACY